MLQEIHEQPDWAEMALDKSRAAVFSLADSMRQNNIQFIMIAARGTSDNAAAYAKYILEIETGIPVALAAPSIVTLYDATLRLSNTLVLGISQSGEGLDIVQVLSSARAAGAMTACITNSAESPITNVSDHVLLCYAGEEKSVAATKTYTTSLILIALLASRLAGRKSLLDELRNVPEQMRSALHLEDQISKMVERYRYMEECAALARGINLATAQEAALKITETSYIVSRPFSGADFMHGPVAMLHDGFPCFLFAPNGRSYPFMLELALKIRERGGEMIIASDQKEICNLAVHPLRLPFEMDEILSPIVYILPGQLFAFHLAILRGENPDKPRGLKKITSTR
jgi:glucosamine--fructose-6-phosphate aminotransferase (isomerizing)